MGRENKIKKIIEKWRGENGEHKINRDTWLNVKFILDSFGGIKIESQN